MCWSGSKYVSLIVVVGGIFYYAISTDVKKGAKKKSPVGGTDEGCKQKSSSFLKF